MTGAEIEPVDAYRQAVNPYQPDVLQAIGYPRGFTGAHGEHVIAEDGRRFLDLIAQNGGAALGHRPPRVVAALTEVLAGGSPFVEPIGIPAGAGPLALRLCQLAGTRLERVYFCTGGSEAIDNAMKFAMAATGREGFVGFGGGFHGFTCSPLPLADHDFWRLPLPGWQPAGRYRVPFADLEALEKVLAGRQVAGVLVETVQGMGGARTWPPGALHAVARCCAEAGTLLIVDEILTGIGRTGRWFGFQPAGIEPDIVVVSKGLSGGITPIAAVMMTAAVHGSVYSSLKLAFVHGSTFEGHLLGMVAGLTVLEVIEQEGILQRAASTGENLRRRLTELAAEGIGLRGVRGEGLLLAVEIEGLAGPDAPDGAAACVRLLLDRGVLTQTAPHAQSWLRLTPPLNLSTDGVVYFMEALRSSLEELAGSRSASSRQGRDGGGRS